MGRRPTKFNSNQRSGLPRLIPLSLTNHSAENAVSHVSAGCVAGRLDSQGFHRKVCAALAGKMPAFAYPLIALSLTRLNRIAAESTICHNRDRSFPVVAIASDWIMLEIRVCTVLL